MMTYHIKYSNTWIDSTCGIINWGPKDDGRYDRDSENI